MTEQTDAQRDRRATGENPREALMPYMKHLRAFVRRELAYYEALGLIRTGELDPQDVVDEVVEAALTLWDMRPPGSLRPWLLQLALRRLRRYLLAARQRPSDEIPLEQLVPAEEQVGQTMDDEFWEFYVPDEVLAWEDLVPDPTAPEPEKFVTAAELSEPLSGALARLGPRVREVFVLYALEGLTVEEIAHMYGWDVDTVKRFLARARDRLREELTPEAGTEGSAVGSVRPDGKGGTQS